MKIVGKFLATFGLIIIASLIVVACSNSGSDVSSGKAAAQSKESSFQFSSPSFTEIRPKKRIPKENSCYGENLSPPLSWNGAPSETKSFALVAEDIDHDTGDPWVHWIVYNIPGDVTKLAAGIPTSTSKLLDGTTQGSNDHKRIGYEGPCPPVIIIGYHNDYSGANPTQTLPHRYVFTLYALQTEIALDPGSDKKQLLESMDGKILAQANTTGKFQIAPTTERAKDHGRSSLNIIRGKGTSTLATSTSK